jgi:hypothetical protein
MAVPIHALAAEATSGAAEPGDETAVLWLGRKLPAGSPCRINDLVDADPVPFPFRDGERNDTPRTVDASLASREACGRPVQLARVPPALCLIGQCPP